VWLKICDGGDGQVNVVPPPCEDGIGFDTGVVRGLEGTEESFPHPLFEGVPSLIKTG
jgi:hypothetical protein